MQKEWGWKLMGGKKKKKDLALLHSSVDQRENNKHNEPVYLIDPIRFMQQFNNTSYPRAGQYASVRGMIHRSCKVAR